MNVQKLLECRQFLRADIALYGVEAVAAQASKPIEISREVGSGTS